MVISEMPGVWDGTSWDSGDLGARGAQVSAAQEQQQHHHQQQHHNHQQQQGRQGRSWLEQHMFEQRMALRMQAKFRAKMGRRRFRGALRERDMDAAVDFDGVDTAGGRGGGGSGFSALLRARLGRFGQCFGCRGGLRPDQRSGGGGGGGGDGGGDFVGMMYEESSDDEDGAVYEVVAPAPQARGLFQVRRRGSQSLGTASATYLARKRQELAGSGKVVPVRR